MQVAILELRKMRHGQLQRLGVRLQVVGDRFADFLLFDRRSNLALGTIIKQPLLTLFLKQVGDLLLGGFLDDGGVFFADGPEDVSVDIFQEVLQGAGLEDQRRTERAELADVGDICHDLLIRRYCHEFGDLLVDSFDRCRIDLILYEDLLEFRQGELAGPPPVLKLARRRPRKI